MNTDLSLFLKGETPWHRDWKKAFPEGFREVSFADELQGGFHRADVYTLCGTAIEFQNSPITLEELRSREAFYPKLIWVLNGKKFKGFRILKHLPDVDDPKLSAYDFSHSDHLAVYRTSELRDGSTRRLSFHHPELCSIPMTTCYYSFCWKHPHRVWYEARCPIVVDLGGHFLYYLKQRTQISGNYPYLHMITRKSFIQKYTAGTL
ncbi:competence protein [Pedobacter sp. JY14-1]|uniref:competence protein CoiA family protein n=1 Tax=Pedobacter sp. JY14-1 TaxID=3034151 RepID=UPI0023E184B5|nr:competence protein [Pedobacter sp. JY14-1]